MIDKDDFFIKIAIDFIDTPSFLGWIFYSAYFLIILYSIFPFKNRIKHKVLFRIKFKFSAKPVIYSVGAILMLFGFTIFKLWNNNNLEAFYLIPSFFQLPNEDLKPLWNVATGAISLLTATFLIIILCLDIMIICEEGLYTNAKHKLFYKKFAKREDLELFNVVRFDPSKMQELPCIIVKTKFRQIKCFESMFKKEDLEKLKAWYENQF